MKDHKKKFNNKISRNALIICCNVFFLIIAYPGDVIADDYKDPVFKEEPISPKVTDCMTDSAQCQSLLDCSDDNNPCVKRQVTFDVAECAKKEPVEKCANFKERLSKVTLKADIDNYVSAPFTRDQLDVELISDELSLPWDLEILPDGSMLVTEKNGSVIFLDAEGTKHVALELNVINDAEAGLMGLAIDPEFETNHFVYLAYSYKKDQSEPEIKFKKRTYSQRILNKISRWTFTEGKLVDENVVMDDIPGSIIHTGLRLEIGPDNKLYATTGDADLVWLSQRTDDLRGKVLRMNLDGTIPQDNPNPESYVYSRGHRNPQGLAWNPESGEMFEVEHGPRRFDELNILEPGKNYGWGAYKCQAIAAKVDPIGNTELPLACFEYWNISPSGMEFVSDPKSPWYGSLFVAGLRGKHLHRYVVTDGTIVDSEIYYVSDGWDYARKGNTGQLSRRLRDVEYWHGSLYVIGDLFGLVKITLRAAPSR